MNSACPVRLSELSLPAKLMLSLFLLLVGAGYLVALANIYEKHRETDLEPGLSLNDLRAAYHGLHKDATPEARAVPSIMLREVSPAGEMRRHLDKGGEPAVRALISWLEAGAREPDFAKPGLVQPGDPSPRDVLAARCVRCHNKAGDKHDVPYAEAQGAEPQYALVAKYALPPAAEKKDLFIGPTSAAELIHVTHAHILSIPVFALIVGGLFLLTGLPRTIKLIVGPLPMLAICCDLASWWLARPVEPFIYVIAAAGAVFGASYGFQILAVAGTIWFGRRESPRTDG